MKLGEYTQLKGILSAAARKSSGTLAVRDLSSIVKREHVFTSDYITTTFVVVQNFRLKEWNASYEKMNQFVVSDELSVLYIPKVAPRHAETLCDY